MAAIGPLSTTARAQAPPFEMLKAGLDAGVVVSDSNKAKEFYGDVLGLKPQGSLALPGGGQMWRYQFGTTTIKLLAYAKSPPKYPGGTREAVGFRLLTLILADTEAVSKSVVAHGLPELKWQIVASLNIKVAFLTDPDANQIELVGLLPDADPARADKVQLGFTVSDSEKTRVFYGKTLGLEELPSTPLASLGGAIKYSFLAGKTTIKFWSLGKPLPSHTGPPAEALGLRYITFLVKDVDAVYQLLKTRGAKIATPPFDFGGIARIMFVADPDGNYIEFAQPVPRPPAKSGL